MKKIALLLVVTAYFMSSSLAQKGSQIGFFYLPQKTTMSNSISDKNDPIYKNKTTFAGGGGISFTYWLKSIGLQTGLMYISHNQKFKSELQIGSDSSRMVYGKKRLDYIKLPLLLVYNLELQKRIKFSVFGGPQFGYLLKGDGAIVIYQHSDGGSDFYDLPVSSSKYYNKFLFDVVFGGGLNFSLSPELTINTALRMDFSISDVENKDATTYDSNVPHYYFGDVERKKSHNSSIGILLGVSYTLKGKNDLISPGRSW